MASKEPDKVENSSENVVQERTTAPRVRRMEDEIRLRELELQTNFQIQTLTESLNLLKTDFHSWRDTLNIKLEKVQTQVSGLSTRLTVVIFLALAQLTGLNLGTLARALGGP